MGDSNPGAWLAPAHPEAPEASGTIHHPRFDLYDLAPELRRMIIECLDIEQLHMLARVSKALRAEVMPLLMGNVIMRPFQTSRPTRTCSDLPARVDNVPIPTVSMPSLAKMQKWHDLFTFQMSTYIWSTMTHLRIVGYMSDVRDSDLMSFSVTHGEIGICNAWEGRVQRMRTLMNFAREAGRAALQSFEWTAYDLVALEFLESIARSSPALQSLKIGCPLIAETKESKNGRIGLATVERFSQLRKLDITFGFRKDVVALHMVATFLSKSPSLTSLRLAGIHADRPIEGRKILESLIQSYNCTERYTNIKELILDGVWLDYHEIDHLFSLLSLTKLELRSDQLPRLCDILQRLAHAARVPGSLKLRSLIVGQKYGPPLEIMASTRPTGILHEIDLAFNQVLSRASGIEEISYNLADPVAAYPRSARGYPQTLDQVERTIVRQFASSIKTLTMRLDLDKAMVPAVYAQCDGLEEIGFIFGSELNCSPVLVRESFEAGLSNLSHLHRLRRVNIELLPCLDENIRQEIVSNLGHGAPAPLEPSLLGSSRFLDATGRDTDQFRIGSLLFGLVKGCDDRYRRYVRIG